MDSPTLFLLAADAILLLHALFVGFVVVGLVLILVGKARAWSWVRNPWFRVAHLVAIGVVVLQSWFGVICPLTTLETTLRSRAGEAAYAGSFVAHWLETLLYYRVPPWVFVVCYTAFGAVVVASWFWVRPSRPS
jgi:multisubunit Na+/H+ antiporter MnhB subunit